MPYTEDTRTDEDHDLDFPAPRSAPRPRRAIPAPKDYDRLPRRLRTPAQREATRRRNDAEFAAEREEWRLIHGETP